MLESIPQKPYYLKESRQGAPPKQSLAIIMCRFTHSQTRIQLSGLRFTKRFGGQTSPKMSTKVTNFGGKFHPQIFSETQPYPVTTFFSRTLQAPIVLKDDLSLENSPSVNPSVVLSSSFIIPHHRIVPRTIH